MRAAGAETELMQTVSFACCSLTTNRMKFPFDPTQHSGVCWVLERALLPPKVFVKLLSDPVRDRSGKAHLSEKVLEDMLSCQRIILPMKHLQSPFLVFFLSVFLISKALILWQRAAFNLQHSGAPRSAAFRG